MKRFQLIFFFFIWAWGARLLAQTPMVTPEQTPPSVLGNRQIVDLDAGWKFFKGKVNGADQPAFDDSTWTSLDLPHTWNNLDGQDGGCDYYRGVGWYRRHLTLNDDNAGKRFFLQFDGANQVTQVYVNGHAAGIHKGGYAAFAFDVTPYLKAGADNVVAVSVDNSDNPDIPPLSADFSFDGGIYRPLWLVITDPVHIMLLDYGSPGVYLLTSKVSQEAADLKVTIKAVNDGNKSQSVTATAVVADADGNTVTLLSNHQTLEAKHTTDFILTATLPHPHLWNGLADPYLYRVVAQLSGPDGILDAVKQPLGFRFYKVDPQQGFFLNGAPLDLHGVCRHQDRLNQGWAITDAQTVQDFDIMRELGSTCVRLSHYQQSQATYTYADEKGLVLWTEIPLINRISTGKAFADNCAQQLTELIRQNFNHPSVFFWGLYNEITLNEGPDPNDLVKALNRLAHQEDPSRLTTCAIAGDKEQTVNWISDVCSFNVYAGWYWGKNEDFPRWTDEVHQAYSNRCVGISEWGAGANPEHHQDPPVHPKTDGPFHPEEYQNILHETYWLAMKTRPFLWWKSLWNAFDFASDCRHEGGTPGRNDKGLTTYDRKTHKDAFYWYKANWSLTPFCYITSRRFTPRETSPVTLKVYSNCDSVEAKVNGKTLGTLTSEDHRFIWKEVALKRGKNRVETIGKRGEQIYKDNCVWVYAPPKRP